MDGDNTARLRRKDTTKGPPLRILSLDGGGVRGYSIFIILQELMHRTFVEIEGRAPKRHEIPKPCDHFDLIAGTGTGGLIAIMLGRLRLDLDTCKDVYVRMTRRVFETDKTFAGIPYKSTMFKASKLEEAIRECVREHTVFEDEGNDVLANATPMTKDVPSSPDALSSPVPHRSMSQQSRYSQVGISPIQQRMNMGTLRWGDPNALLYDTRENRTKTAVTGVFQGTSVTTLLRSYDSRKEPAPDVNCTIWQAARATCAIALAFKPIQIGQSRYLDEGAGKYNPAPLILDEAVHNEWPGREVGVFVSIGTGKRPSGTGQHSHEWWEGITGGTMSDYAEARRRLITKMEACEETHQLLLREGLTSRQVNVENYYRLNVEIGVGEFGMNEWARLSEISTNTRQYLSRRDTESINQGAAVKMAKIHFAKQRHERAERRGYAQPERSSWQSPWDAPLPTVPLPSNTMAVELPGDDSYTQTQSFRPGSQSYNLADEKYSVLTPDSDPHRPSLGEHRPSVVDQKYIVVPDDGYSQQARTTPPQRPVIPYQSQMSPTSPYNANSSPYNNASNSSASPRQSTDSYQRPSAPPLPPKTPLPYPDQYSPTSPHSRQGSGYQEDAPRTFMNMGELGRRLPYPDVEGPPPAVNAASKPTLTR